MINFVICLQGISIDLNQHYPHPGSCSSCPERHPQDSRIGAADIPATVLFTSISSRWTHYWPAWMYDNGWLCKWIFPTSLFFFFFFYSFASPPSDSSPAFSPPPLHSFSLCSPPHFSLSPFFFILSLPFFSIFSSFLDPYPPPHCNI